MNLKIYISDRLQRSFQAAAAAVAFRFLSPVQDCCMQFELKFSLLMFSVSNLEVLRGRVTEHPGPSLTAEA